MIIIDPILNWLERAIERSIDRMNEQEPES